jgi:hypothetical protein
MNPQPAEWRSAKSYTAAFFPPRSITRGQYQNTFYAALTEKVQLLFSFCGDGDGLSGFINLLINELPTFQQFRGYSELVSTYIHICFLVYPKTLCIERVGVNIKFYKRIRSVFGSNICQDLSILTEVLCVILQSTRTNSRIITRLGHDRFLPNPLQFIIYESSNLSTIYSLNIESVTRCNTHARSYSSGG